MSIPLKQSTAFTWKAGPFIDDTDGKSAKTALTIAQADIRISKNGGDYAQTHNTAGATHDEYGEYDIPLDTTDTGTLGKLRSKYTYLGRFQYGRISLYCLRMSTIRYLATVCLVL